MWIQSTHFTFDQPTSISLRAILMSFNSKRSASLANFHSFSISANEIQSVVEQHFDIMAMHCPINIVNCSISTSSTYPLAVREDPVNERLHVQTEFCQTAVQPTFGEVAVLHRPGFLVVGVDENSWDVIPLLKIIW